jgi:hypothetical protein
MNIGRSCEPRGFQQILAATLAASTGLTIPTGRDGLKPDFAIVQCDTQNLRWRDDQAAPTASVGMRLLVGGEERIDGLTRMTDIRFIVETAGGNLNVSYYRYA